MTGLEKITTQIIDEAAAAAKKTKSAAQAEADKILASAKEEYEAAAAQLKAEAEAQKVPGNWARGYGYPMMKMEPIENMCGSYKMLIVYVEKSINKIMMENMGMMPKAISKDKYHKEMNEMLCEVMKKEKELKEIVVVDRCETEDTEDLDRNMCPYCGGFLKDTLGILFLTELLKRGCTSCY